MNSTNAGNAINKSWLFLIPALALALTLTWVLSIRPIRLKIANYYFQNCKYEQASRWYEKVVRKKRLNIDKDTSDRLLYEEDLSKFESALIPVMEGTVLKVSRVLGFGESKDSKCILMDPKLFLKDINHLVGDEPKKQLQKLKEDLGNFINISSYYKNLLEKETNSRKLNYFVSMGYFLAGIVDEAEGNFLSADSNYEKAANSSSKVLTQMNERRKKILPKVADEYFSQSPSIRMLLNANVVLQSPSPLIITGVLPGVHNYLEYVSYPVEIILQKYPYPKLKIQGEVFGGARTSCIIPTVVFWGPKGHIGENTLKYSIEGNFDINFSLTIPDGTLRVTPLITFDNSCFSEGQKIFIRDFKWY